MKVLKLMLVINGVTLGINGIIVWLTVAKEFLVLLAYCWSLPPLRALSGCRLRPTARRSDLCRRLHRCLCCCLCTSLYIVHFKLFLLELKALYGYASMKQNICEGLDYCPCSILKLLHRCMPAQRSFTTWSIR